MACPMSPQGFCKSRSSLHALAFLLLTALALVAASMAGSYFSRFPEEIVIGGVGVLLTLALTSIFLRWDQKKFVDIGVAWDRRTHKRLLTGFAVGFALVALHAAIVASTCQVRWVRNSGVDAYGVAIAALGYGLLALREELAFRGYPLRTLLRSVGASGAQLTIAVIFIAEHRLGGATWTDAVFGAGLGAAVFGVAALVTRGIAFPFGLHAAWNFGDWMRGGKGDHGVWIMQIEAAQRAHTGDVAMIAYVAVMLLALCWLIALYWRDRDRCS